MVFTRSKKRSCEDLNENEVKEVEVGNVTGTIKRKKPNETEEQSPSDEDTFITETDTDGDDEEDGYSSEHSSSKNGHSDFMSNIIKDAIKKLFSKVKGGKGDSERIGDTEGELESDEEDKAVTIGNSEGDIADELRNKKDEYKKLKKFVESIYDGSFFQRVPIEDKIGKLRKTLDISLVKELNDELEKLKSQYEMTAPSILDIIKQNIPDTEKQKLLEKVYLYTNSEVLSSEYNNHLKTLLHSSKDNYTASMRELHNKILDHSNTVQFSDDYREKILKSEMPFSNMVIAFKKLETMEGYESSDSSEYAKYKNWMDILLSIPFGKYIDLPSNGPDYLPRVRNILDQKLSYLEKPKDQIINIFSQMVRNKNVKVNALGLCGKRGCGKTSIVQSIAEALNRPYRCISLGGESDASMLTGHNFTYVGSIPGRIIDILRETKCMNPVILIDELDKISETNQGKEIIGTLIHLTDTTTNMNYNYDKYFSGLTFDLSKVLFVFTYNDRSKIDRILADRIFTIDIENYTLKEKLEIVKKHIKKNVLDEFLFTEENVEFTDDAIEYIVEQSRKDEGMRDIKRKFEVIISRVNTLLLTSDYEGIIKLKYKKLKSSFSSLPVKIEKEHIDIFLEESFIYNDKSNDPPPHMYI
uniref:AAA+ ATPase domain-containing protein n=1 Tax=viral metagenome TaxID=1070528 RepID=A0A6C0DZT7_9ZZZZ